MPSKRRSRKGARGAVRTGLELVAVVGASTMLFSLAMPALVPLFLLGPLWLAWKG